MQRNAANFLELSRPSQRSDEARGGGTLGGYLNLVDPNNPADNNTVLLTNWHVVRPSNSEDLPLADYLCTVKLPRPCTEYCFLLLQYETACFQRHGCWQDECFALRFEHIDIYASRTRRHKPGKGNCYGCVAKSNYYLLGSSFSLEEDINTIHIPPIPDRLLCLFRHSFVFTDEPLH